MKLVITGGTGFIGRHLTSYLGDLGHEILLIQRSDLKQGADRISKLIKSSDVIINLAGSPVIKRWTSTNKNEMLHSRISTTNILVDAVTRLNPQDRPKVFLSASAIGIYNSNEMHNESSTAFDTNFLGNVCQEWESCLVPLKQLNTRICVLRIGIVLGKEGGMLKKLIPLFNMALGGKIGSGKQSFSFVHYHDFCRIVSFLIDNSKCEGVFNLTAPEISNNEKFTDSLAKACRRPALFSVPEFALKLVYGDAAVTLIKGQAVYPKHLLDCGFKFQFPDLNSAIGEILGHSVKQN
jgi:uncharacterized protein (TIGR01777 family)